MLIVIAIILLLLVLPAPIGIAVLALAVVAEFGEAVFWRRALRRYRIRSGAEAMIGRTAGVSETCRPQGGGRFDGAVWEARCGGGAGVGGGGRGPRPRGVAPHV